MNDSEIESYLSNLMDMLLSESNSYKVVLTRDWARTFPSKPGVYILWHRGMIVYVGETGNIRGRMYDILNTQHHTVRRTLGAKLFRSHMYYQIASSKKKYHPDIEKMLN